MKQYFLVVVATCLVLVKTYSDKELEYVYKSYNEAATLKCPETENVTWVYDEWQYNSKGQTFLKETPLTTEEEPILQFKNLTKKNEGIYKCYSNGKYIKYFRLFVDKPQPPRFTNETITPYRSRFKGNFVLLKCPAVIGFPSPDIRWIHNGTELPRSRYNLDVQAMSKLELEDAGNYTCQARSSAGSVNFTFHLEVFDRFPSKLYTKDKNYRNLTIPIGTSATLICTTSAGEINELIKIVSTSWYKLPKTITNLTEGDILKTNKSVKLVGSDINYQITNVNSTHEGWYACIESGGYDNDTVHITSLHYLNVTDEIPQTKWIFIVLTLVFLIFVVTIALCVYYRKRIQKEKMIALEESNVYWIKKIIIEKSPDDLPVVKIERHKADSGDNYEKREGQLSEYELPVDLSWEISRNNLVLGEVLGSGAFGKVLKAEGKDIFKPGETSTVAVKMLKENYGDEEMLDLVSEMEIMKMLGTHPNIINLIGCCTQDGPLYVVVEYAPYGSLLNFLRRHQLILSPKNNVMPTITEKQLVQFACQVAQGMDYLTSKKYIHRDLAARNILVTKDYIMKIADFGLAKECDNYYRKKSGGLLPVKWMAPEALILRIYTTKSDVWSFGILLHEIMSLGEIPYPTIGDIEKLLQLLRNGYRMEKPNGCSRDVYTVMRECWNQEPKDRPTFSELIQKLSAILGKIDSLNYASFDYNPSQSSNSNQGYKEITEPDPQYADVVDNVKDQNLEDKAITDVVNNVKYQNLENKAITEPNPQYADVVNNVKDQNLEDKAITKPNPQYADVVNNVKDQHLQDKAITKPKSLDNFDNPQYADVVTNAEDENLEEVPLETFNNQEYFTSRPSLRKKAAQVVAQSSLYNIINSPSYKPL